MRDERIRTQTVDSRENSPAWRSGPRERDLVKLAVLRVGAPRDHRDAAALVDVLQARVAEVQRGERPQHRAIRLAQLQLPLAARFGAPHEPGPTGQPVVIAHRIDPCVVVLVEQLTRLARLRVRGDEGEVLLVAREQLESEGRAGWPLDPRDVLPLVGIHVDPGGPPALSAGDAEPGHRVLLARPRVR